MEGLFKAIIAGIIAAVVGGLILEKLSSKGPSPSLRESTTTPITFEFEGKTWTVVEGGNGAPMSALHLSPGAAKACPSLKVRLLEVTPDASNGGEMTAEQIARGDTRWKIQCVRN